MKYLLTKEEIKQQFPNFNSSLKNANIIISKQSSDLFIEELYEKVNKSGDVVKDDPLGQFKFGDRIQFISGYDNHILYESRIFGFEKEDTDGYAKKGMLYVYVDSYWFPIPRKVIAVI